MTATWTRPRARGTVERMPDDTAREVERVVLPHLDAAYRLARWLTGDDAIAEDLTHEALLKAFRYFQSFRGDNPRAWLLSIVRNTCCDWLSRHRAAAPTAELEEDVYTEACERLNPETLAAARADAESVTRLLMQLPAEFREAIVLRELEGLSYQEIATATGVPIGTVMSRLARARRRLERVLTAPREAK